METNDKTIRMEGQQEDQLQEQAEKQNQETRDNNLWKKVSFGTAAGILIGGGTIYAVDHIGGESATDEAPKLQNVTSDDGAPQPPIYDHAPVAQVSDSMSFSQAFAEARSQVGAGGVFSWHGGVYGTYYETEWDAMSPAQRTAYAHSVNPEVRAQHIDTTHVNENHPDVAVHAPTNTTGGQQGGSNSGQDEHGQNGIRPGNGSQEQPGPNRTPGGNPDTSHNPGQNGEGGQQQGGQFLADDEDVHVVGRSEIQGHEAVAVDVNKDGQPDAVIIDIDDNHELSDPDVVILRDGRQTTMRELAQDQYETRDEPDNIDVDVVDDAKPTNDETSPITEDPVVSQTCMEENPEVAPDMPDYMDDVNIMS